MNVNRIDLNLLVYLDALLRELWTFKGDRPQLDDVTMVAARWNAGATTGGS